MSESPARRATGLSAMKLDELKAVASSMGLTGIGKMRKGDLLEAIRSRQSGGSAAPVTTPAPATVTGADASTQTAPTAPARTVRAESALAEPVPAETASDAAASTSGDSASQPTTRAPRTPRRASRAAGTTVGAEGSSTVKAVEAPERDQQAAPQRLGHETTDVDNADAPKGAGRSVRARRAGAAGSTDRGNRCNRTGDAESTDRTGDAESTDRTGDAESTDRTGDAESTDRIGDAESTDRTGDAGNAGGAERTVTASDLSSRESSITSDGAGSRGVSRQSESLVEEKHPTDGTARDDDPGRRNRQERQERALRAVRETAAGRSKQDSAPSESQRGSSSTSEDDRGESSTSSTRRERADKTGRTDRSARADQGRDDQAGESADDGQQRQAQSRNQSPQSSSSGQGAASGHDDTGGLQNRYDDDERGSRRSRNRQRSRDRKRGRTSTGGSGSEWPDSETAINDDDVLVPVGGILDVLDNYAFVRTSGYLSGPDDVYVPLGLVKKHALRKGDAVTGVVKALREGETPTGSVGRQKFNALVRLDSVNGAPADESSKRADFVALTPLYPQERLRLETEPRLLTTRIIDLIAPIGKGQRGLIVAPANAGKTMVLQGLANAITANNPECHLMVVLIDERPEEVTEMQRAVKGEVIASTFDRPAEDHTTVAELAIERAKRLVELGHDVVVLLDSITKLGRAYNLSAPATGRVLPGGVDAAALYPPKKFFGAARNVEYGGSLTILATALVETGSKMDEVIFEEFKGTANMELHLSGDLAVRRVFPNVDIAASGTRREEILLAGEEIKIMWKLRRSVADLDTQAAAELMIERLRKTRTNYELLTQVQASR